MNDHDDPTIKHVHIGPLHMGFRKRSEPIPEWVEFAKAVRRLGSVVADASGATWLVRELDRLLTRIGPPAE